MQTQEPKKHFIWSEDDKYDETAIKEWWRDQMEILADDINEDDLARTLDIDDMAMTDEERQALTTLLPLYQQAQIGKEPDREAYADMINDYLFDECDNLNKTIDGCIIGLSSAGRWDGRRTGAGVIGNNIKDCISAVSNDGDMDIWCEADGLHITLSHHDGTNYYLFRIAKDRETAQELQETILRMERDGKSYIETSDYFVKHTTSLYSEIANIYGWELN